MFRLALKPSVAKDLKSLPKHQLQSIFNKVELLAKEPIPYYAVKLTGTESLYRIRVGDYRIVYGVHHDEKQVLVHYIRHRRDVYRSL